MNNHLKNPFGHEMGLAMTMGPKLKAEVERQLLNDLEIYHVFAGELRFDWSNSCIEGKCMNYLDGSLDCFSGIMIYDAADQLVCDGWMDFYYIEDRDQLIVYWDLLDIYIDGIEVEKKSDFEMPEHIKTKIKMISERD